MVLSIEKISNEGAEIYCERRGDGRLVLMIHGAMEDAGYYSSAADILADKFTVVSYDRRCNSRSSGDRSVDMSIDSNRLVMLPLLLNMWEMVRLSWSEGVEVPL